MKTEVVAGVKFDTTGAISNLNELTGAIDKSNNGLLAMRKELKRIQSEMLALEPGTDKFNELSAQAGKLKDQMKDVSESVNANAGPALENLSNNFGLLAGRLSSLDFSGAADSLRAIGGNIGKISFKEMIIGIKSFGSAAASVGRALLTNPIFLIGAAIAAAGVAIKMALDSAAEAKYNMVKAAEASVEASKKSVEAYDIEEKKLRALGVAEDELYERRVKMFQLQLAEQRNLVRAQAALVTELGNEFWIDFDELKEQQERLQQMQMDLAKMETDGIVFVTDFRKKKEKEREDYDKKQHDARMKMRENEDAAQIKADEEEMKRRERERNAFSEQISLSEQKIEAIGTEVEERTKLETGGIFATNAARIESEQETNETIIEMDRETMNARLQIATQYVNAASSLNDFLVETGLISAKKGFQISKALGIAQATISTFEGVVNALSAKSTIPEPFGQALKIANAAAIAAAGIANIARIARTKFNPEGGGDAGGGGGMGAVARPGGAGGAMSVRSTPAPSFNPITGQLADRRPGQIPPSRAYILQSEVASQAEASEKLNALTVL